MSIKHSFVSAKSDGSDTALLRPSDWNDSHDDTTSVLYYDAVGDGITDDTAAFQAAIDAVGVAFVPAGTYYLATPVELKASGDGLRGEGRELSKLKCATGGIKVSASQASAIENCLIEGLYIYPSVTATAGHSNNMAYADYTAIDITGLKFCTIRDIYTYRWQTHLNLGHSTYQTYKNTIINFQAWLGSTGIYIGGTASPTHDGANANAFIACNVMAQQIGIRIAGGYNLFCGTRIESPLQTSGYPLTSTGVQFDSGLYAIGNSFVGTYMELTGTGNSGIVLNDTGTTGYLTPNSFYGGNFVANSTSVACVPDSGLESSAFGFTLNAPGLRTRNYYTDSVGAGTVAFSRYYDDVGGTYVQTYDGSSATLIAQETMAATAPSTGTWVRGARVWNTSASASGYVGWVCASAGSPGIWKGFGAIAS